MFPIPHDIKGNYHSFECLNMRSVSWFARWVLFLWAPHFLTLQAPCGKVDPTKLKYMPEEKLHTWPAVSLKFPLVFALVGVFFSLTCKHLSWRVCVALLSMGWNFPRTFSLVNTSSSCYFRHGLWNTWKFLKTYMHRLCTNTSPTYVVCAALQFSCMLTDHTVVFSRIQNLLV